LADDAFLSVRRHLNRVTLILNSNHPIYHRFYMPLAKAAPRALRQSLDLTLLALARALLSAGSDDRESWRRLIDSWSNAAALLLEER
jgi:hypothetical protein